TIFFQYQKTIVKNLKIAHQINGFVVIVVIGIFMLVDDVLIVKKGIEQCIEMVSLGNKDFGNIAAAQTVISENILTECFQFLFRFISGKNGHGISVFSNDVRLISEIIFKIAAGVVASCSNDCIKSLHFTFGEHNTFC